MLKVHLKKNREKPIVNGHPWIFSGAIAKVEGGGTAGAACRVFAAGGEVLGHGYYNAKSSISVRMLTRGDAPFDDAVLTNRLECARKLRAKILSAPDTDSCRLINAEGDFLPGLAIDKYASGLCMRITTAGMEAWRGGIIDRLASLFSPAFIYERSDMEAREREGIGAKDGVVAGAVPRELVVRENGLAFGVDLAEGQKTGFYFDQRQNRLLSRLYAPGRRCLDCFSYSGAFAVNMLAGGAASVTAVDISKSATAWCSQNLARNGFEASRMECVCADVFDFLRGASDRYDVIILDPPKFAKHPGDVARASRGYKDINLVALQKIAPGGIVFTFSCSNAVDQRLFRQIVFAAAADAGRNVQLLHVLSAGPDHPVNLSHPEGEYLKGLVLRVE